jgi:3-oxoadipate CoA-transferase, beta subunit
MTAPPLKGWSREEMAQLVAEDIADGAYVNLGIGIPELVAQFVPQDREFIFQTENGLLGMGPTPPPGSEDPELINAGKKPVTAIPGAAYFHHADSFTMIRGGHIDVAILGAFEVAANGDLANWDMRLPNKGPLVGGAMDLAACARSVWIMMEHVTRQGTPRLLDTCVLPLTAVRCVKRVYTDLAVIDITPAGMVVREMLGDLSEADLRARTGAPLTFTPDCRPLKAPAIALPD